MFMQRCDDFWTASKNALDRRASPLPGPCELAQANELRELLLAIAITADRPTLAARTVGWDSDRLEKAIVIEDLIRREGYIKAVNRHNARDRMQKLTLAELRRMQQQQYG
jgi:hypothetical protein